MATAETGNGKAEETVELMQDFLIPEYILNLLSGEEGEVDSPEDAHDRPSSSPRYPVLVFVNSGSGGQLGLQIIPHLQKLLHPKQVVELKRPEEDKQNPHWLDDLLKEFLKRLDTLDKNGDTLARDVKERLRFIVAGGDGTHGWLLRVVGDLGRKELPPMATIPLGTGNNLPYSFGWGKKNPPPTVAAMREILQKTADANPITVDRWHVTIRMSKTVDDCPPLTELPSFGRSKSKLPADVRRLDKVQTFQLVSEKSESFKEGRHSYEGDFWNYFSIGMDSEISYAFHNERRLHPEKFKNQHMNQLRYVRLSWTQGWFCASCRYPRSKNIKTLAKIFICKKIDATSADEWDELEISPSIRSVLMLNLPSFSGGLNPWGTPSPSKVAQRGLTAPYVNDGLIEIVGLRDGWHGMSLVVPPHHGTRLAQAHKVKIEFHAGGVDHTYMRIDGEPWVQDLPPDTSPTVMEISHKGQAVALAYGQCVSQPLPKADADKEQYRRMLTASFNKAVVDGGSSHGSVRSIPEETEFQPDEAQSIPEGKEFKPKEASVKQNIPKEKEVQQEEPSVSGTG